MKILIAFLLASLLGAGAAAASQIPPNGRPRRRR